MLLCDDSGWGSLLNGVAIGLYDTDKRKFKHKLIPVSYFKDPKYSRGEYRDHALKLFIEMWMSMGSTGIIHVCRGTVLDSIVKYLEYKGYGPKALKRVEIGDPLQSLLEEEFALSLVKIGVPRTSRGAHCMSFNDQLKWVQEDPKRVKHVKTGWPQWRLKYSKQMNLK